MGDVSKADLQKALIECERFERGIEADMRREISAEEQKVRDKYNDRMDVARGATRIASQKLKEFIDKDSSHPLDGFKVFKLARVPVSRWGSDTKEVRKEGIVEVVRSTSKFASNRASWGLPMQGQVIVRKIKKDGNPSLDFYRRENINDWTLDDSQ